MCYICISKPIIMFNHESPRVTMTWNLGYPGNFPGLAACSTRSCGRRMNFPLILAEVTSPLPGPVRSWTLLLVLAVFSFDMAVMKFRVPGPSTEQCWWKQLLSLNRCISFCGFDHLGRSPPSCKHSLEWATRPGWPAVCECVCVCRCVCVWVCRRVRVWNSFIISASAVTIYKRKHIVTIIIVNETKISAKTASTIE